MRFENLITVVVISESKNEIEIEMKLIILGNLYFNDNTKSQEKSIPNTLFLFFVFLLRTPKFRAIHSSVKLRNPEVQTKQCCC